MALVGFFLAGTALIAPLGRPVAWLVCGFVAAFIIEGRSAVPSAFAIGLLGAVVIRVQGIEPSIMLLVSLPLAAVVGALVGTRVRKRVSLSIACWIVCAVIIAMFAGHAYGVATPVAQRFAVEPANEDYHFDPVLFMKVYYLMERGESYYAAYADAFTADARFDQPTVDLGGWRTPTTFWLWALLFRNGAWLVWGFVVFSAVSMGLAYVTAIRTSDPASALIAPALLGAYFAAAISSLWFTELEFWAGFFVIASAALWATRHRWLALPFATLAALMREWLISAVIAGFVASLKMRKWGESAAWGLAGTACLAAYVASGAHAAAYLRSLGLTPRIGSAGRVATGGVGFILNSLGYSTYSFLGWWLIGQVAFYLALVVSVYLVWRGDYYLPILMFAPLAMFMLFGNADVYYSAAFMPYAFILVTGLKRVASPALDRREALGESVEAPPPAALPA